jgi:hypothetical protein
VSEFDEKIREYYALRPTDYYVVRSISLNQSISSSGEYEQSLSIVLQKELANSKNCLYLEFYAVRKLVLQQTDWSRFSIGHIEILAPTEVPAGGNNFMVRDPEQERTIMFECRDFDVYAT